MLIKVKGLGVDVMAFSIETLLKGYEFRRLLEDTFKDEDGHKVPYMQLWVEHPETCEQSRISVPKVMFDDLVDMDELQKGNLVDVLVNATGGATYSKLRLIRVEHVYTPEGEVLL